MRRFIKLILISFLTVTGCTKEGDKKNVESEKETGENKSLSSAGVKEHGVEFKIEYELPRKFFKIEREDLNNDGIREVIVFSTLKDTSDGYSSFYNFDMMEIFALDTEGKSYVKLISDTVDYSSEYSFADLGNNGSRQILIYTNSGGNDIIVSKGMFVYGMDAQKEVRLIKYFDTGDPVLRDLKEDGTKEIIISDEFWGVMPHSSVIYYVSAIFGYDSKELIFRNSEFREFFDEKINELKEKYYGVKRKVEMGMQPMDLSYPLYREAAEVIVNYQAKGDTEGLKKFWNEEKNSLQKNIPEDEFGDLNNYVKKVLPAEQNA